MRRLTLDPIPFAKLESLHNVDPAVARVIEGAFDWIESDPVDIRARRRRFTNGMCAFVRSVADVEWLVLWEEDPPGQPIIRVCSGFG